MHRALIWKVEELAPAQTVGDIFNIWRIYRPIEWSTLQIPKVEARLIERRRRGCKGCGVAWI